MPLYEFQCKSCGREFEDLVLGSTRPACPSCSGQELKRLLSVFALNGTADDPVPAAGECGTCGDPRGPGACSIN